MNPSLTPPNPQPEAQLAKRAEAPIQNIDERMAEALTQAPIARHFMALGQGQSKECQVTQSIMPGRFYLKAQDPSESIPIGVFERTSTGEFKGILMCLYLAWRPKAVLLIDNTVDSECFDVTDPEFKRIMNTKEVKPGAGEHTVTPLVGFENLFYIPPHQIDLEGMLNDPMRGLDEAGIAQLRNAARNGLYASYHWTKTNKQNAVGKPESHGGLEANTPLVIRTKKIETARHSWWTAPERAVLDMDENVKEWVDLGLAHATDHVEAFLNPQTTTGEAIEDNSGQEGGTSPADR
jgi:hypothetical protein